MRGTMALNVRQMAGEGSPILACATPRPDSVPQRMTPEEFHTTFVGAFTKTEREILVKNEEFQSVLKKFDRTAEAYSGVVAVGVDILLRTDLSRPFAVS
jgi:hypothetical protein